MLVLAVVLLIGFALLRPSWFGGAETPSERTFDTSLVDIGLVDGLTLSDDNATSQTFTVPVPLDAAPTDLRLALVGRTEVAASGTVFLRVLADGISVHVEELEAGQRDLEQDVRLPASVTDDGEVRVQVRTTGSLDQQQCNLTQELGAYVWLDPDRTSVGGDLGARVTSVRDTVATLDHDVTLQLAGTVGDAEWFETAARLGVALTQLGHEVRYQDVTDDVDLGEVEGSRILLGGAGALTGLGWEPVGDPEEDVVVGTVGDDPVLAVVQPGDVVPTVLSTNAVHGADRAASAPRAAEPERPRGPSVTVADLGLDTSVQQVTDRRSWRLDYALPDLPGGLPPRAVRLGLDVPPTTDDARWLVSVQVNGRLATTTGLPGAGTRWARVPLPATDERLRNQLVVTLVRDRDVGGCHVRQTAYDVQLLPDSRLLLGDGGPGLAGLPAELAAGFDVLYPEATLEDPVTGLTGLVPTLAEFSGWQQPLRLGGESPSGRPFLSLGTPAPDAQVPMRIDDGRMSAPGVDLPLPADGTVVQRGAWRGQPGLMVTPTGDPGTVVPDYGREVARVEADGAGFVVTGSGRVVTDPPVRARPGG